VFFDSCSICEDSIKLAAESFDCTGNRFLESEFSVGVFKVNRKLRKGRVQKVFVVLSNECICVTKVNARQEKVIRIDQIIGDRRIIRLDVNEESPTKMKDFTRSHRQLFGLFLGLRFERRNNWVFEDGGEDWLEFVEDDCCHREVPFEAIDLLSDLDGKVCHVRPLLHFIKELDQTVC
jgi:hypothetical protein